jgi:hypothetical protein
MRADIQKSRERVDTDIKALTEDEKRMKTVIRHTYTNEETLLDDM